MNTFKELMSNVYKAKDELNTAEEARDCFLEPILQALGATGGGIDGCVVEGNKVYITRTGSTRGCSWNDDYTFPLDIFNSENPLLAAEEYATRSKKAQQENDRLAKKASIERLQKELSALE